MVEPSLEERKSQLIAELARSRAGMSQQARRLEHDLDVPARLKESVVRQKGIWLTGAAALGWLLAGWPRRKPKALGSPSKAEARHAAAHATTENRRRGGWLLALLSVVGTMIRPAVTAFVSRRLSDWVSRQEESERYLRR